MVFAVGLKQRLEEQEKDLTVVPQANPLAWPNILKPSRPAHRELPAAPFPGNEGLSAREENPGPVRKRVDPFLGLGGWSPKFPQVTEADGETPNVLRSGSSRRGGGGGFPQEHRMAVPGTGASGVGLSPRAGRVAASLPLGPQWDRPSPDPHQAPIRAKLTSGLSSHPPVCYMDLPLPTFYTPQD